MLETSVDVFVHAVARQGLLLAANSHCLALARFPINALVVLGLITSGVGDDGAVVQSRVGATRIVTISRRLLFVGRRRRARQSQRPIQGIVGGMAAVRFAAAGGWIGFKAYPAACIVVRFLIQRLERDAAVSALRQQFPA